jgi:hypothetical protein
MQRCCCCTHVSECPVSNIPGPSGFLQQLDYNALVHLDKSPHCSKSTLKYAGRPKHIGKIDPSFFFFFFCLFFVLFLSPTPLVLLPLVFPSLTERDRGTYRSKDNPQ